MGNQQLSLITSIPLIPSILFILKPYLGAVRRVAATTDRGMLLTGGVGCCRDRIAGHWRPVTHVSGTTLPTRNVARSQPHPFSLTDYLWGAGRAPTSQPVISE